MTRLNQACFSVAARTVAFGIAAIISMNLQEAVAQGNRPSTPVEIVNTPVPVTGTVTGTITGNVAVTNTPNVNVSNQITIRDADNAGRHAVTIRFNTNPTTGSGPQFWDALNVYTVPAGKRLVIEDIDAEVIVTPPSNTGGVRGNLVIYDGTNFTEHPFGNVTNPVVCTVSQTCFSLSRLTRVYADAGNILQVSLTGNLTGFGAFHLARGTINGYLVDLP
jgi:hypothetical protein